SLCRDGERRRVSLRIGPDRDRPGNPGRCCPSARSTRRVCRGLGETHPRTGPENRVGILPLRSWMTQPYPCQCHRPETQAVISEGGLADLESLAAEGEDARRDLLEQFLRPVRKGESRPAA